jgi:homoserine O-acetyltransferase
MSATQYFTQEDIKTASGTVMPLTTAYRTFGDAKKGKAVLMSTCFNGVIEGTLSLVGEGKPLNPREYFVVVVGLFGGSEARAQSTSQLSH